MAARRGKDQKAEMKPAVSYGQGAYYGGPAQPREKKPPGSRPSFLSQEPAGKGGRPKRDPNAAKNMMQDWCRKHTEGYEHVDIHDFNTSFNDGMALCALVHHFFPNEFDYNSLDPDNRKENFHTAFSAAKKLLDVEPIIEAEEIVKMSTMDWKVTFTYIQSLYRRLCQKKLCTPMKPPEPTSPQ